MSGGGAQSCLMGVTGNSELYTKYLEANGAAMKDKEGNDLKDNVKGSQCWFPITNLDTGNASYEWNLGQYYSKDTRAEDTFTNLLSNDLSFEFVKYINALKIKDPKGHELSLTNTNEGTYYDYLKSIIEESLNNFLADTKFPWTRSNKKEFPRGLGEMIRWILVAMVNGSSWTNVSTWSTWTSWWYGSSWPNGSSLRRSDM